MIILSVLLDVRAVFTCLLALQVFRMPFVPFLLEFILGDDAMAMHAVAARRALENLAATLGAAMVAATGLLVEATSRRTALLCKWCRTRRLDVSGIAEHGDLNADFWDTMLVL